MDTELATTLETKGISNETCQVLEEEGIVSIAVFSSLREKHWAIAPKIESWVACSIDEILGSS